MITPSQEDRDLLLPELRELLAPLSPDARGDHDRLLTALEQGSVSADLVPTLEDALELLLTSGQIRRRCGPFEELQLFRLYQRTPAGQGAKAQLEKVNDALDALKDQPIRHVGFSLKLPGVYRLEIATDQGEIVLAIDRHAVAVHQLEVHA